MCPPSARHPCVPRIPIAECRSTFQHIFTGLPRGDRPAVAITAGGGRSRLPAGGRGSRGGGAPPPPASPPPRLPERPDDRVAPDRRPCRRCDRPATPFNRPEAAAGQVRIPDGRGIRRLEAVSISVPQDLL